MADLLAGTVVTSADITATGNATENTIHNAITSTTYAAGSPVCGTTFTAPTTERVAVHMRAYVDNNTGGVVTALAFEIREGGTIGSGTITHPADDAKAITHRGTNQIRGGMTVPVENLTAGATYNVRLMHRVTGGTGTIDDREVTVEAIP